MDATQASVIDAEQIDDAELMQPHGDTCDACGAPVERLDRFCTACGGHVAAESTEAPVETPVARQRHFRCKNCGSEVATDPKQRSYTCPFCDSTYVVEFSRDASGRQQPEFVIGFSVTREAAQEKFHQWLTANSWFRPGDLATARIEKKLAGIYLPFWSFSMLARSSWSASIGEHWYRTETYTTTVGGKRVRRTRRVTETEWWDLDGRHHQYHSGYLVSGSESLPQHDAARIQPFQLPALKRYRPDYLAGWLCEEYTVPRDAAQDRCEEEFQRRQQADIAAFLPGDRHRGLRTSTTFSHVNSDLILLPVYLLSYRYGDRVFRFLINGQTGKVAGNKPLSSKRITAAILTAVGVVVGIGLLLWLLSALAR